MTDGPHRSLNKSRAWKRAAEALAKPAFTDEADDRVCSAIVKDFKRDDGDRLVRIATKVMADDPQQSLFNDREDQLDAIRAQATPNSLTDNFLRNLRQTEDISLALSQTLEAETLANLRTVEDHYIQRIQYRETSHKQVAYLRDRSNAAMNQIDFNGLAQSLGSLKGKSTQGNAGAQAVNRVEEGPPI